MNLVKITKLASQISIILVAFCISLSTMSAQSGWVAGDFHQHTTFTDGSYSIMYMMQKDAQYNLKWWANSEHGGGFNRNGLLSGYDLFDGLDANGKVKTTTTFWDTYSSANILGNVKSGTNPNMWRWQSLRDYSYYAIKIARNMYPSKIIFQGYEWNVPGHEHCSFSTFVDQFKANDNEYALSEFEFRFDANDKDTTGGLAQGWTNKNFVNDHAKAVQAITWLQNNHRMTSWTVFAHPERKPQTKGGYQIKDFRDFNNAGPDVAFGFESVPGHQMGAERGGYTPTAAGGGTYGGSGYFSAKVGGLWDAMLSEGRHFWLFSNSDCHDTTTATGSDFFPGEYQKNYTYLADVKNPQSIVDGMRSGNSWVVSGDLIDSLNFKVEGSTMGETANVTGKTVNVTIRLHDPETPNYNVWSTYNNPKVDHIDLIGGKLGNKIDPADAQYNIETVNTTKVIARFDAVGGVTDTKGIVSKKWNDKGNGWKEMTLEVDMTNNMYFRLRGTNLGLNVAKETDGEGNPLADSLMGGPLGNTRAKAFADLWFYSNPIFVKSSALAIKEGKEVEKIFSVYPNPTNSAITVTCPTGSEVKVIDLKGQVLTSFEMTSDLDQIDLQNFTNGTYIVEMNYNGQRFSENVIKY
ncbi:MAG: T9SS type A sorting domain-containing protein [bacterium]